MGEHDRHQGQLDGARAKDVDLRVALRGLAALVTTDHSTDEFLTEVARWAALAIPGADGAAVTLIGSPDGDHQMGSWPDFVAEIHLLQDEIFYEGPHFGCLPTQAPTVSESLDTDLRWPRFGRGVVAALGVFSLMSWPLLVGEQVIGAIDAYARASDAFDEYAVDIGGRFAEPAAVAVYNARQLRRAQDAAKQLQHALSRRAVVDQAVGIVRGRTGASAEEALARLVHISHAAGIDVAAVAQQMVEQPEDRSRMRRP